MALAVAFRGDGAKDHIEEAISNTISHLSSDAFIEIYDATESQMEAAMEKLKLANLMMKSNNNSKNYAETLDESLVHEDDKTKAQKLKRMFHPSDLIIKIYKRRKISCQN